MKGTASDDSCKDKNIYDLSFDIFNKLYFENFKTTLDPNWLGWFTGFAEGDGYLGINGNIPVFVLTQKESKILYEIRDVLNFGIVTKFDQYTRYIVRDKSSVLLLFHLFNGNLHIQHKIDQLEKWSILFNNKNEKKDNPLKVIIDPVKLSFNNSWLLHFTLDVLVQHQYAVAIQWQDVASRFVQAFLGTSA